MGFFRYYLAMIVILAHIPFPQVNTKIFYGNGGLAVLAFYVISGFYMSLIVEKYHLGSMRFAQIKNFYFSRALRIYPIYYLCILITLILYVCNIHYSFSNPPWDALSKLGNVEDKIIYVLTNAFIFGLDVMKLCVYDPTIKAFAYFPNSAGVATIEPGSVFSILGQAWSLSMELCFYLLVPFILTKNRYLILTICLASWILRLYLFRIGFDNPPYQGGNMALAFFPTGLGVFLLGAVGHRFILPVLKQQSKKIKAMLAFGCLSIILIYTLYLYDLINNNYIYFKFYLFIFITAITTPCLFAYFDKSRVDQYIGELSYPLYMTHLFCIGLVLKYTHGQYMAYLFLYILLLATVVSALLIHLVVKPVDRYRHEKFRTLARDLKSVPGAISSLDASAHL